MEVYAFMSGLDAGSDITLSTSNGTIESAFGVTNGMVNTTVRARVRTTNAAVRLFTDPFESMHPNSSFILDVSTSEAPVAVYMGASYEGTYDLQTTEKQAEVDHDQTVKDPSEMGRRRTVHWTVNQSHDRVWGHTYWSFNGEPSNEGRNRGSVSVRSTKSVVSMYC